MSGRITRSKKQVEPKVSAPPAPRRVRTLEEAEAQVTALRAEIMATPNHIISPSRVTLPF